MNIQQAIAELIEHRDLDLQAMTDVMREIMTGQATAAQIGGFLVGLRMKGETIDEITAAAKVMRELSNEVVLHGDNLVDIVGTGGDSAGLFNVSTAASFVAAAAGAKVAKHGNRSVTSSSGSTDLLEAAGVYLNLSPAQIAHCIDELGIGYMFAVNHHSAMKHAIGPRKQLAARTIFNILGPLTNPAGIPNMLLGVFSPKWQLPFAQVLDRLGAEHVLVVHADDGLDEISIAGPTQVVELNHGEIAQYTIRPEDFGLTAAPLDSLVVANAAESLDLIKRAYSGEATVARDMLALNAGAALYAAGISSSMAEGVVLADDVMSSGQAWEKLKQFAEFTTLLGSSE